MPIPVKSSTRKDTQQQDARAAAHSIANDYRDRVAWLALFLTNDELLADACVVDTLNDASMLVEAYQDESGKLLRQKVIHSAAQIMRWRIGHLAPSYRHHLCESEHPRLSDHMLELLVTHADEIRRDLDTLCRFVLVLYGIEACSAAECSRMLAVSEHAVEAAYCVAMQEIQFYSFELLVTEAENIHATS